MNCKDGGRESNISRCQVEGRTGKDASTIIIWEGVSYSSDKEKRDCLI